MQQTKTTGLSLLPQTIEETIIWTCIVSTYVLFFMGAQFIIVPMVSWLLLGCFVLRWYFQPITQKQPGAPDIRVPLGVWVWVATMLVMLVVLMIGLMELNYDQTRLIKSFVNNFMRTWGLLAVLPLVGCLPIRPQVVARAVCLLALQSLIFIFISYALVAANVEMPLYTASLMAKIGGFGDRYYTVSLYFIEGGTNNHRLTLFAPWAPALAFVASVHLWIATLDPNRFWRWLGIGVNIALVLVSESRMGMAALVVLPVVRLIWVNLVKPTWVLGGGLSLFLGGLLSAPLITGLTDLKSYIDGQRGNSSQLRATLQKLTRDRISEAPIWGHGIKAPGPELVRGMPLGSHHSWWGVLFVHGFVGFTALVIAMGYSLWDLGIKALTSPIAQAGFMVLLTMLAFSFSENLETLAYMYWPGLIMLGISFKEELPSFSRHSATVSLTPAGES